MISEQSSSIACAWTWTILWPPFRSRLSAAGRAVHSGKSLFLAEATVSSPDGSVVARGSGLFVRSKIALTPDIGYGT